MEAAPGFEPGVKALQASALPLGHAAAGLRIISFIKWRCQFASKRMQDTGFK